MKYFEIAARHMIEDDQRAHKGRPPGWVGREHVGDDAAGGGGEPVREHVGDDAAGGGGESST